ncbi:MAG: hypothetical protein IJG84_18125 [Kiritimatiellae bacterium]|nr:hypothetical protein [Kiritimatiellia bacterium]
MDRQNRIVQTNLSTAFLHQKVFPQFKGIHVGRDIAVIATGPSLLKYKPIPGCINIGVNSAFMREGLDFDYIFAMDLYSVKDYLPQMNEYRKGKCIKFYGLLNEFLISESTNYTISESDAMAAGAFRFRTDFAPIPGMRMKFAYDISTFPLGDCYSTVFAALQFACWTHPKTIYIVGCDSTDTGHYNSKALEADLAKTRPMVPDSYNKIRQSWREFKVFVKAYYPKIRVVSVNPVGLRGEFEDLDQ